MSYSNDNEKWFRSIIMDHYHTPRNKGLVDDTAYMQLHLKNPSCGDDLILQVKIADGTIADIRFEGTGCAICCASASMLTHNVKHKQIETVQEIIEQFLLMVSGHKDFDADLLDESISLQGVAKLPPRIKCATLGYKALEKLLTGKQIHDSDLEEVK